MEHWIESGEPFERTRKDPDLDNLLKLLPTVTKLKTLCISETYIQRN